MGDNLVPNGLTVMFSSLLAAVSARIASVFAERHGSKRDRQPTSAIE
jgi:hypothetical protein